MRKWLCVPMMTLLLLLSACGEGGEEKAADLRDLYHDMAGCVMEAAVTCSQGDRVWQAELRCVYEPDGKTTVEVLAPESIAGVRAVVEGDTLSLEYEDLCLNAGTLSRQSVSPMACLPQLMSALRDGWLLEENEETWEDVPCRRLLVDQSGTQDGKIVSAVWLREEDGTPLRGEISVDGENILTAEFTSFAFYDTIEEQGGRP